MWYMVVLISSLVGLSFWRRANHNDVWAPRGLRYSRRRCPHAGMLFATPWSVACQSPLCPWNFPDKNTGVGCHFLLQGIFPTQHRICVSCISCTSRQVLYQLSHQGTQRTSSRLWSRTGRSHERRLNTVDSLGVKINILTVCDCIFTGLLASGLSLDLWVT